MAGKRDRAAAAAGSAATDVGAARAAPADIDPTLLQEANFFNKQIGGGGGKGADGGPWQLQWIPKGYGEPHYWWWNETTDTWRKASDRDQRAAIKAYWDDQTLDSYAGSRKRSSQGKGGTKGKGKNQGPSISFRSSCTDTAAAAGNQRKVTLQMEKELTPSELALYEGQMLATPGVDRLAVLSWAKGHPALGPAVDAGTVAPGNRSGSAAQRLRGNVRKHTVPGDGRVRANKRG